MNTTNILVVVGASLGVVWLTVMVIWNAHDLRKLAGHTKQLELHDAFLKWLGHDSDLVSKYSDVNVADYYKHRTAPPVRGPFQTLDNRIAEVRSELPAKQGYRYEITDSDKECHLHWKVITSPDWTSADWEPSMIGEGDAKTLSDAQQAISDAIIASNRNQAVRIIGLSGRLIA